MDSLVIPEPKPHQTTRLLILGAMCLLILAVLIAGYQFFQTKNHEAKLQNALMSQKLTDEQKLLLMQELQAKTENVTPLSSAEKVKLINQPQKKTQVAPPLTDAQKLQLIESAPKGTK